MKSVGMEVLIDAEPSAEFVGMISGKIGKLPPDTQVKFWTAWDVLKSNGCEMFDMTFVDGKLTCDVSEDFRLFLAEFGIVV